MSYDDGYGDGDQMEAPRVYRVVARLPGSHARVRREFVDELAALSWRADVEARGGRVLECRPVRRGTFDDYGAG